MECFQQDFLKGTAIISPNVYQMIFFYRHTAMNGSLKYLKDGTTDDQKWRLLLLDIYFLIKKIDVFFFHVFFQKLKG